MNKLLVTAVVATLTACASKPPVKPEPTPVVVTNTVYVATESDLLMSLYTSCLNSTIEAKKVTPLDFELITYTKKCSQLSLSRNAAKVALYNSCVRTTSNTIVSTSNRMPHPNEYERVVDTCLDLANSSAN